MDNEKHDEVKINAQEAFKSKNLLEKSFENITEFLNTKDIPERFLDSIEELLEEKNWEELNNRFHTDLAFGTGGMRGRTIGKAVTKAEKGKNSPKEKIINNH